MKPVIAFVHLGKNPSPTLIPFSAQAKNFLPESDLVLITDCPELWSDFPGEILHYLETDRHSFISNFENKYPELKKIASGYWLYTFERLFALTSLSKIYATDRALIHFESDVLSFIDHEIYTWLSVNVNKTAVPRYSANNGIASILYSPSISTLAVDLNETAKNFIIKKHRVTDMDFLGHGLNSGTLIELPSIPTSAESKPFLFDGAAIGQYIVGIDPVHTNGFPMSGYINKDYPCDLREYSWSLNTLDRSVHLFNKERPLGFNFRIANLHVHSKEDISIFSPKSGFLEVLLKEANYEIPRAPREFRIDVIHTQKVNLIDRIRLIRRKGLKRSLINLLSRRLGRAR
jgi:hypothetical protein